MSKFVDEQSTVKRLKTNTHMGGTSLCIFMSQNFKTTFVLDIILANITDRFRFFKTSYRKTKVCRSSLTNIQGLQAKCSNLFGIEVWGRSCEYLDE